MVETIASLLKGPGTPFALRGPNVGQVASLAAGIVKTVAGFSSLADEPLCLCLEERSDLLAAFLATLAGAPPLILPHATHPQVLREIHQALPFRLVLADGAVDPPAGTTVISIRDCGPGDGHLSLVRPPDRTFAWLFTGGSTGAPKIWSKTPQNLFGEAFHLARTLGVGPEDLVLSTAPPQHIYGLLASVLLPFVASARVVPRTCTFPREILATLEKEKPSVLVSVPIHYRMMAAGEVEGHSLRLALSSAAPLSPEDAARFREKTGVAVTEIYGSTETGGMALRVAGGDHGSWEPFSGLSCKIQGERLLVRSDFLSPDLPCDAEGFFLTADRVERAGSGFRLLGRADHVVKIAGKRVDLEEIREKIRRIPGVTDACVVLDATDLRGPSQTAALVATGLPAREIRAAVRALSIPCGRPRKIRTVPSIPVLPNGKFDRERIQRLLAFKEKP
jgi:acyl-coenzyme A synthetase/AMP-(fatty) acid ligase